MIASTVDSRAVNTATQPMLAPSLHPGSFQNLCKSHFLSNVGKECVLPHVTSLVQILTALQVSGNAKDTFFSVYAERIKGHNQVRWYCDWEQAEQQFLNYQQLSPYALALENGGLCPATTTRLSNLVRQNGQALQLQLATNHDAMGPFVRGTYNTEGDSCDAVFLVFETMEDLRAHVRVTRGHDPLNPGLPNVRAIARNQVIQQHGAGLSAAQVAGFVDTIVVAERGHVEPAFVYFENHLVASQHAANMKFFDAARHFHPGRMLELTWNGAVLQQKLAGVTFLDTTSPDVLLRSATIVAEAGAYLLLAQQRNCTRATDTVEYVTSLRL